MGSQAAIPIEPAIPKDCQYNLYYKRIREYKLHVFVTVSLNPRRMSGL